jgi:DNA repair protein RecN (Recombination protein N)
MLIELNINNLKLIKKAQLQFGQGFHVITGESGAGKSMLLSAFKLLLGEKPQGDIVYPNTKKSQIEAIFDIKPLSLLREKMLELGVEDDDETLILRREISSDLRSKIFANNTRITQKTLKELSGELIDFHGQNTHQSLLDNKKHGPILDEYLELEQDLEAYLLAYKAYLKINQDYEDARGSVKEETQELDYLKFQFQELITLNLRVGEYEELQEERHRLKNVTVYNLLLEETNLLFDGEHSVQSNLQKMAISLNKLKDLDGKFHDLAINISELSLQASDASSEFARYNSTDFLDPEQLEKIEERLFALESIQRKHHRNIPEIICTKNVKKVKVPLKKPLD